MLLTVRIIQLYVCMKPIGNPAKTQVSRTLSNNNNKTKSDGESPTAEFTAVEGERPAAV